MENYVGKRLDGRYEIHEIIGVGGMSVVYKAYDNVDDRIVAVKILKDEFANDDEFVRRFKNESKAIAVLSHPNIVKVYDVSFGDRIQYIVMEYVDGITLKEYIQKQGRITWNDAVFFISQVLKALQHAHDKGIVHRDVKPQNIMLLQTGDIKVTDFGIARFSRTQTETLTENAIGSVHYISPEQAQGKPTDERADIYSLGVVCYEMLAGRVPFESDSAVSVALMQVKNTAKRLKDINADIPIGLEQICVHAMQKDPLERYQTATEMLLDLEEISMNPNATFDYSYVVDKQPTKYIRNDEFQSNNDADEEEDEDYAYDKKNKKKIIIATISGLAILLIAIVVLVLVLTKGVNKNTIKLQNFVGMAYDDVVSNKDYDFKFVANPEKTSDYESGTIIAQTPVADERVMAGSVVTLTVAQPIEDIL
ncbi:MAG: Stk1 family PASTA domain-containing Ser/Thr kinase, partial [Eubacterium sp.]|nr:Stk1 family PASTA domain-containing Ser/Thr kinase [Eubacterium sp.]